MRPRYPDETPEEKAAFDTLEWLEKAGVDQIKNLVRELSESTRHHLAQALEVMK